MKSGEKDFYFGFKFVRSFVRIFPHLYKGLDLSLLLTLSLFLIGAVYEYVNYHTGTIIGKFYGALVGHDENTFWHIFLKASLYYIGQTLMLAFQTLISCLLGIALRKNLTTSLHKVYFNHNVYYKMNCIDSDGIDNPDQRITQDTEKMTRILAKNILPYLLISPGVIIFYTYKTWENATWIGVACIYVYFLFGAVTNRIIVSPFTKWIARSEKAEGDFRYKHVSVRDHAEESAFYDAADFDKRESDRIFDILMQNITRLALWNFLPQFFQNFFDYYGGVLTYAIQVIPVFILNSYKNMDPDDLTAQISNNAFYFMYLINSFTRLTDLAMSLGEVAGYSQRIFGIFEYGEAINNWRNETVVLEDNDRNGSGTLFKLENLTCSVPSDRSHTLVKDVTMKIPLEKSLLITGSSGVGKTSLLRILKQLWPPSQGSVSRFISYDQMLFLPQECYFPVGGLSLKKQLLFPSLDTDIDNNQIVQILESLKLSRLIGASGSLEDPVDFEWQDILSPGEQQRLSIARALIKKPKVVVLDEATSNMTYDMEQIVYDLLKKNGIGYISVGHRASLREIHDFELKIGGGEKWTIAEIKNETKSI